ncbi:hypothetical protein CDD81_1874 [Ophiocordyceps australis]|uniref:GST N-terminal domain-containing protein n=1 Tax=Ophiocordyceps australis TaxID=1399860 RepID=A0A2C5XZY6_9HYPO|nr:hypothetical protein CDD81_1874 [Ophiocordyceps australis]
MAKVDTSIPGQASGAAADLARRHAGDQGLKLYGGWFCPFVQRTWMTLCEKKIEHQYIEMNPYGKEAEFLRMNPRGLVPTLVVPGHGVLFESSIICHYLDEAYANEAQHGPALLPGEPFAKARASLLIDHVNSRIIPAFYKLLQHTPTKAYSLDQARQELHGHLGYFVEQMDPVGPWTLGGSLSLVDISLAPWAKRLWLIDHYKDGGVGIPAEGDAADDAVWKRWRAWFEAIVSRQSVKDTWSDDAAYIEAYKRYAQDTTRSLVGQATRQGQRLP